MSTSSYEIRVQGVVDKIVSQHQINAIPDGKEVLLDIIRKNSVDVTDYKMGGRTQKEFVTDVMAGLKGKLKKPKVEKVA